MAAPANVSTIPIYVNRPVDGYPSFWATSEWKEFQSRYGVTVARFDQGPLGHTRRKPTGLGTNMVLDEVLADLPGPGSEIVHASNSLGLSGQWAKWAPGLVKAMSAMIRCHIQKAQGKIRPQRIASISADFICHVQRGHIPFRRDCQICLQGAAQMRAHRKVLHPDSWTLSMDLSGPFALSKDEFCEVRSMLVGVLTVPIMEKQPLPGDKGSREPPAPEPAEAAGGAEAVGQEVSEVPVIEPDGPIAQVSTTLTWIQIKQY